MLDVLAVSKRKEQRKFPSKLWWENNFDQKYQKFARLWQRVLFFSHDTFAKCTMSYYVLHHVQPLSLTLFSMTLSSEWCASRFRILKEFVWAGKKLMQQSSKKNNLLRTFADSSKCTSMPKIQFELCLSEISFDCKPFFKKSTSSVSSKFANKVYFAFVLLLGWLKM